MKESAPEAVRSDVKIRYVNPGIIFDYMAGRDPDAVDLKRRREDLLKTIDDINNKINDTDETRKQALLGEVNAKEEELAKLRGDEDYCKGRILTQIAGAIEAVARGDDIDFVFNLGEGALYARKEYDITEKVLREIESRMKRGAPVSR